MDDTSALGASLDECRAAKATQDEAEQRLKWHIGDNLRWLADQSDRPDYMPCGVLTGKFLIDVAARFEAYAKQALTTEPSGDEVELVARALFDHEWRSMTTGKAFNLDAEYTSSREYWLDGARAALAAIPSRSTVPSEVVEALKNPTEAMFDAAWDASGDYFVADDVSKEGLRIALSAMVRSALSAIGKNND